MALQIRHLHLETQYLALTQDFEAVKAHMHIPKLPYGMSFSSPIHKGRY